MAAARLKPNHFIRSFSTTNTGVQSLCEFKPADRLSVDYSASGVNVWMFITEYMNKYNTVNHGQGFPNWHSPNFVKEAAKNAINSNYNQYCPPNGHPLLIDKLIQIYSKKLNQPKLCNKNIQTTIGACGGIENCLSAILNPNDDVLTFEPYFDFYLAQTMHSGGNLITVPMIINSDNQWDIDLNALDIALSTNTKIKAIILNTPQNPTGYVMNKQTMDKMVKILQKYPNVIIISDEVYEDIIFDDYQHLHIAAHDGMFDRTLTVNSAAKKFSATGWKMGWVVGPQPMIEAVHYVARTQNWCQPTPLQVAVSEMLSIAEEPFDGCDSYWKWLRNMYQAKRDKIVNVLECGGLRPMTSNGSFFCVADAQSLMDKLVEKGEIMNDSEFDINNSLTWMDWKLSKYLAINAGVTCLPMSAFLTPSFEQRYRFLRFSFCATDDAFDRSLKGMQTMMSKINQK